MEVTYEEASEIVKEVLRNRGVSGIIILKNLVNKIVEDYFFEIQKNIN
jgi:hypothetical protein